MSGLPTRLSDATSPSLEMDAFLHESFGKRVVQRSQVCPCPSLRIEPR
jgi:hypothetical protein